MRERKRERGGCKAHVDKSVFKDGISQFSAESLLLARVVSHVLQHRCTVVKDNTTSLLEFTKISQRYARVCKDIQE